MNKIATELMAKKRITSYIPWLIFICIFGMFIYNLNISLIHNLDSDMSSELILGKLLSKQHRIITSDWSYSTEVRVLDMNIIYSIIFLFTDSFFTVRIISAIVIAVLWILAISYLCKTIGYEEYCPWILSLLYLPLSGQYAYTYLYGNYYVMHSICGIVYIASCLRFAQMESKKKYILVAANMIMAFMIGMEGLRDILLVYGPVLLLAAYKKIRKKSGYMQYAIPCTISAVAGYAVNCLWLSKITDFVQFGHLQFTTISIDRLMQFINGLFVMSGYETGEVLSGKMFANAISFILLAGFVVSLIMLHKKKAVADKTESFVLEYVAVAYIVLLMVYLFTDLEYQDRYQFTFGILLLIYPFVIVRNVAWNSHSSLKTVAILSIVALFFIRAVICYDHFNKQDTTTEYREIAEKLVAEGYTNGYASYWNGNILTELTDDKVDVYTYTWPGNLYFETEEFDDIYPWLQKKAHFASKPEGKMFILLNEDEMDKFSFAKKLTKSDYDYNDYHLYLFDSYEDAKEYFSGN